MGDLGLWPTAHDARAKPVQLSLSTRGRQRFGCTSGSATRAPRCRRATLSWGTQAFLLSTRLQVSKRRARCFGGDQCSGARRRSHRHGARVSVYKMSHPWRGPAVSHPEAQDASRRERLHMSLSLSLESCCPWHPTSEPCSLALQPLLPRSSRDTFSSYVTCPPSQAVWVQRASDPWTAVPGGRPRHVVAHECNTETLASGAAAGSPARQGALGLRSVVRPSGPPAAPAALRVTGDRQPGDHAVSQPPGMAPGFRFSSIKRGHLFKGIP